MLYTLKKKRQGQSNALPFLNGLELLFCLFQGFFQFGWAVTQNKWGVVRTFKILVITFYISDLLSRYGSYCKQKLCQKYQLNILYDVPNGYLQSIIAVNPFFTKFYEFYFTLGKNLHTSGAWKCGERLKKSYYGITDILLFFLYNYCTKIRNLS